jgi:hypothetical protein
LMSQSVDGGKPVRFSLSAGTWLLPSAVFAFVIGAREGGNATPVPCRGGVLRAAAGRVHAVLLYKAFYEAEISRLNAICRRIVMLCRWCAAVLLLDIRASSNPFREGFLENLQQRPRGRRARVGPRPPFAAMTKSPRGSIPDHQPRTPMTATHRRIPLPRIPLTRPLSPCQPSPYQPNHG